MKQKSKEMKYIGPDKFTINHGTIMTRISVQRVPKDRFPSGIGMWMSGDSGGLFGMTDRNQWVRV